MIDLLLIRHAHFTAVGQRLAGWSSGVGLDEEGRYQAMCLANAHAASALAVVVSSPLLRARQTAEAIAAPHRLHVQPDDAFGEVRFGTWTGRDIDSLSDDAAWHAFNRFRSGTRIPDGDIMLQVQARAISRILELRERHPDQWIAIVTHGDVIRAVLAYWLGVPLDLSLRIAVHPASVTHVRLFETDVSIESMNSLHHLQRQRPDPASSVSATAVAGAI